MQEMNFELESKVIKLGKDLQRNEALVEEGRANDSVTKLAEQIDELIAQKAELQERYQLLNERNKQLRHKAGQVFLQSVEIGGKVNVKSDSGAGKIYLEDEEAIHRMIAEIELQDRGDLKERLKRISFSDSNMIWQKHFVGFIKDELHMNDSDQIRLLRVSGFSALKDQTKGLKYELVLKNFEDRLAQSAQAREDCIKKVAKLMLNEGFTLESAMRYFDDNNNGFITRHEFNEAFKMMKITLNETLMKNCFVILDRNGDNHIDLIEFEEIFGKYFNTKGGPVK